MSKKNKNKETVVTDEVATKEKKDTSKKKPSKVENSINRLQSELEKEKDRNLRLFAEFENYKKRTQRERIEMFKTAGEDVIISMLPVLDDFDRALLEIEKSEDDSLLKGIELINNKLKEVLQSKGLEEIVTKQGDKFNADDHESITQIQAPSKTLRGKIIDVIEKGYVLGDKIIRYPKVIIGK